MSLFRKQALDSLSTPEQLDQPMQLLRPSYWALLIGLLSFGGYIIIWTIFGRLPVRITGSGVLTTPNSIHLIQSEVFGRVKKMNADVGICVNKDEPLALIEPVKMKLEERNIASQLTKIIKDHQDEKAYDDELLDLQNRKLDRFAELINYGAISQQDFEKHQKETLALKSRIFSSNNQRKQRIQQLELKLAQIKQEMAATTVVKSTETGCIVGRQVQIGQLVQPATTLFELNSASNNNNLTSLGFFAAQDGKRLKLGQQVRITPTTTKAQRHGGIQGVITKISPLPVSQESLSLRLGNKSTVNSVIGKAMTPLIEVTTSLKRDNKTISGYDWGGGGGPNLVLSSGTSTTVSVIVEERAPISYVIPLLRDLSGIY